MAMLTPSATSTRAANSRGRSAHTHNESNIAAADTSN